MKHYNFIHLKRGSKMKPKVKNGKKKSLIGWGYNSWNIDFVRFNGNIKFPLIKAFKNYGLPSNRTKVRITIEELK